MWVTTVNRRQFIDVVEAGEKLNFIDVWESDSPPVPSKGDSLTLVWRGKPAFERRSQFPAVVVVDDNTRRDFLAWALTYFKAVRPFTAFCRVIASSVAEAALRQPRVPSLRSFEDAALGLVLGEAMAYSDDRQDARPPSVVGCASTCSFAVGRALGFSFTVGGDAKKENIWRSWFNARLVTHQPTLRLTFEELRTPWLVVLRLQEIETNIHPTFELTSPGLVVDSSDEVSDIAAVCIDLRSFGEIRSTSWDRLTRGLPELHRVQNFVRSSREERVRSFEQVLEVLLRMPARSAPSFLAGCIVSQIGPGTMDHVRLLEQHVERLPAALLWYGLCAGLDRRANLKSVAGGLGRRILRDMLREESFLDQPRSDIALSELEILAESESRGVDIRSEHPGQLKVEIAPCVSTLVRWPSRIEASRGRNPAAFDEEWKYLMVSLDEALGRVDMFRKRLATFLGESGEVRDRSDIKRGRRRDK